MLETQKVKQYKRRISPLERMFLRSPYSIVTVVAKIKGNITENMLKEAVQKVQQRHTLLRVRIVEEDDHDVWFTSEGINDIPIEIVSRKSEDHWISVLSDASKVPFEFNKKPAIRFILVKSLEFSELIILCHHTICDGMSLAFLARDLMIYLGDPNQEVEILPDPIPMDKENLPKDVKLSSIVKKVVENSINKKWDSDKIFFDQEDYENLNETYWMNYSHKMTTIEFTESQTSMLIERCRKEKITVNTALCAAFAGAQSILLDKKLFHPKLIVAGNVRDRLQESIGESIGFYVGAVELKYKYNYKIGFWDNARNLHKNLKPLYTNINLFKEPLLWCHLGAGIMDSLSFKMLGKLVPPHFTRYDKLTTFSRKKDVISAMLKREKMDSLNNTIIGTAITNLTNLHFPRKYGNLELDRLIMNPGGAYPLTLVNIVVGAVTCSGKLSLVLEYAEKKIDPKTMEQIMAKALNFLIND